MIKLLGDACDASSDPTLTTNSNADYQANPEASTAVPQEPKQGL